jgi:hypothetical protein
MAEEALDPRRVLEGRVAARGVSLWDVRSTLLHFAMVNYALPKERLLPHVPGQRFAIAEFPIGGRPMAMLSVVPFWDTDFRFVRLAPGLKFRFAQTNHRVYVIDRLSGEPAVWFFGTTLGSWLVRVPRLLWKLPWHAARYRFDCVYDRARRAYSRYELEIESDWCGGSLALEDTGAAVGRHEGFASLDEQRLLTHPIAGYCRRLDGRLASYSIWHDQIPLTAASVRRAHFGLYERLGILSRDEMARPHSAFLCPAIEFDIHLPPRVLRD